MLDIKIERGDIFCVKKAYSTVGCEQQPGRPGIVVSNNANNRASRTVEVVYCTTREKPNLPTHTIIHSTSVESTVLCEQITTVSVDLLGTYIGKCTSDEMRAIDKCLAESIGISHEIKPSKNLERLSNNVLSGGPNPVQDDICSVKAELDTYKRMYEIMVNKLASNRVDGVSRK